MLVEPSETEAPTPAAATGADSSKTPAPGTPDPQASAAVLDGDFWVTGWYAGWYQDHLPPGEIDFDIVTHLIHFMITPTSDGGISVSDRPGFETPERIAGVVNAAHSAGREVLVSVGGAGFYEPFRAAIEPAVRPTFVESLRSFVAEHGYDGVDVDMEPIHPEDYEDFQAFVIELRAALVADNPDALVTVAAGPPGAICPIQEQFDQVNLMTYDMSGPWEGWVTWHNSPIVDGGLHFPPPHDSRPLPSAEARAQAFLDEGCDAERIAIGTSWYAYVWEGVTEPLEEWETPPEVHPNIPYFAVHENNDLSEARWDEQGQAAYLSQPDRDRFISFDNEQSVAAKVAFSLERGFGGLAIWELAGGYLPGEAVPDPLLQALGEALAEAEAR